MDLSKLSSNDRSAVFVAAVVVITGFLSLIWAWGTLMLLAGLAGLVVLGAVLLPQLSPSTNLPAPKGLVMLGAGVVAAVSFVVTAFDWIGWIGDHLATFDTIQFLVGLVASLVLAWIGWRAYQEAGHVGSAAPPPNPPA
jgi:hypothetical protein